MKNVYLSTSLSLAQPTTTGAQPSKNTAPDDRATEFKAVEGGAETRSGGTLMVEAYCVIWIILMGWIFMVWRKQAGLHARLDELEKALDKAADKAAKAAR